MRPLTIIILAVSLWLPGWAVGQVVPPPTKTPFPSPSSPGYSPPTVPKAHEFTLPPIPKAPPNAALGTGGGQRIFVKRIEVEGVTAFDSKVIAAIVVPYENRDLTSQDLEDLRVRLTRLYIAHGYINSGVLIPAQRVQDGVVQFKAIEGKLTEVRLVGKTHLSRHYLVPRIRAHVGSPLNVSQLQTALRFVQQDPNVERLAARLGPGDAPGQSVLQLGVVDKPRFSVGIGGDNYQSPSIGANEGRVFFDFRDLTGFGEEIQGSVGHSKGNTLGSAVFSIPLSAHDAGFQAYYSRGNAVIVQQPFAQLNIKENIRTYGLMFTIPLVDHLTDRFAFFVGGESDRAYTELLGTGFSFSPGAQNGVSDVTEAYGGFDWLLHGSSSVTDLRLTYRHGLDALGATLYKPDPFNPDATHADGRFGLEQLQFIHIQRLNGFSWLKHVNDRAQFVMRATGQLSQQPLLSVAKFAIGGVDTVRGFPENSFVRDDGVAATLELQLPIPGYRSAPGPLNLVLAPFVDYGRSWDKVNANPGSPLNDTSTARYMAAAGMGLLWNPFKGMQLQVYWGRGIANNFGLYDPRKFIPHDLQYHGVYASASYVYRW